MLQNAYKKARELICELKMKLNMVETEVLGKNKNVLEHGKMPAVESGKN
jgi:hypothetical protein